jgi:SlyX protein
MSSEQSRAAADTTGRIDTTTDSPRGTSESSGTAEAIADLQMRLTYQEDEIQHLNRVLDGQRVTLDQQAMQIEQLRRLVVSLSEGLREKVSDGPPPHY